MSPKRPSRLRLATTAVVGLIVVGGLTGCDTTNLCSANPVLALLFCRDDSEPTPPIETPALPPLPKSSPSAEIDVSDFFPTVVETVTLDGSWSDSDGSVVLFEWDLDGTGEYEISGEPAGNHDVRTVAFTDFGDHTVRLRVTDDDGLVTVWEEEITLVRRRPVAVLHVTPEHPKVGQEVTFDARDSSAADSTLTHYRWDIDGDNPNGFELRSDGPTVTRIYEGPQTITVGVRAFDDQGDRGEATQVITIDPATPDPPPPPSPAPVPVAPGNTAPTAALAATPNPAVVGDTVTLDATGSSDSDGTIAEYRWDFDGNGTFDATGAAPTQTHAYTARGTVTPRVQVVDNGGRSTDATLSLAVRGPTAVLTVTPNPARFEELVTFSGAGSTPADPAGSIATYEWDLDGNGTFEVSGATASTTTHYFTFGTITVSLRVTHNRGFTDVATAAVEIPRVGFSAPVAPPRALAAHAGRRAFVARLDSRLSSPGRLERRGKVQMLRGAFVTGSFNGRLAAGRLGPADALLAKVLRARYRARLDASVDRRTGVARTRLLAVAAKACLLITIDERPGRKPAGTFRVLGAPNGLVASGRFTFTKSTLSGTVRAALGPPRACNALR